MDSREDKAPKEREKERSKGLERLKVLYSLTGFCSWTLLIKAAVTVSAIMVFTSFARRSSALGGLMILLSSLFPIPCQCLSSMSLCIFIFEFQSFHFFVFSTRLDLMRGILSSERRSFKTRNLFLACLTGTAKLELLVASKVEN
jgi:hypothetical protein